MVSCVRFEKLNTARFDFEWKATALTQLLLSCSDLLRTITTPKLGSAPACDFQLPRVQTVTQAPLSFFSQLAALATVGQIRQRPAASSAVRDPPALRYRKFFFAGNCFEYRDLIVQTQCL